MKGVARSYESRYQQQEEVFTLFVNFTNHPSDKWSFEQLSAAKSYGEIINIPFPMVDPQGDENYIKELAEQSVTQILSYKPSAVLCQGEMTLAFAIVSILAYKCRINVFAACSERVTKESVGPDGKTIKTAEFRFVRFRKYF